MVVRSDEDIDIQNIKERTYIREDSDYTIRYNSRRKNLLETRDFSHEYFYQQQLGAHAQNYDIKLQLSMHGQNVGQHSPSSMDQQQQGPPKGTKPTNPIQQPRMTTLQYNPGMASSQTGMYQMFQKQPQYTQGYNNPPTYYNTQQEQSQRTPSGGAPMNPNKQKERKNRIQFIDPNSMQEVAVESTAQKSDYGSRSTSLGDSESANSPSPNNEIAAEFAAEMAKRLYPSMGQEKNHPQLKKLVPTGLLTVKEYLDRERPSTNKNNDVEDMLTELDSLLGNLGTSREPCISTKSDMRRKLYYDRQTLMTMRCHPLALRKPRGLPDIPDILLDKPTSDVYILDEGYQPTDGYFLPTTMFSPMKQKAKQPSKQQKKENKTVNIPMNIPIEEATELPESNVSTSTYITTEEIQERENPFIDEVLEVSGKKGQPMETHDTHLLCDLCQSDVEYVKAEHYCPECNEFLCQICAKVHKKSRASKHHVLQDQHDMPTAKLTEFAELACTKHNGETIKYFCKNHDQGCCTLCITTEHNKCKFDYIEDIGRNYEESDEFKTCIQTIKDIEEQLKESKQKSNGCAEIVRQNFEQVMTDINKFREVINKKVDDLEKVTREEMLKAKDREMSRLDTLTAKCQSMTDELAKLKNDLDEIKKYKQRKQLVLSTRKGQTQVSAYVRQLKAISAELTVQPYSFVRNMELLVSLNHQKNFGILSLPERRDTYYEEIAKPSRWASMAKKATTNNQ